MKLAIHGAAGRMGRAVMTALDRQSSDAGTQFEEIVKDFPAASNVHYAYATFLIGGNPDHALAELQKELELQPNHLPSLVLLALEYLKRGDAASAKPFATQAVSVAPGNFAAHVALGRTLLGLDDVAGAIKELELAVKLEPTSPQIRIALASAYRGHARHSLETAYAYVPTNAEIGLPRFYVSVIFHDLPKDSFFIGDKPANDFVRIWIDQIARMTPPERRPFWLERVSSTLDPFVKERGYRWEIHIDQTPIDLWSINGMKPPDAGSEITRRAGDPAPGPSETTDQKLG